MSYIAVAILVGLRPIRCLQAGYDLWSDLTMHAEDLMAELSFLTAKKKQLALRESYLRAQAEQLVAQDTSEENQDVFEESQKRVSPGSEAEEHAREAVRLVLKNPRELAQDRASYSNNGKRGGHAFSEEFEVEKMLACHKLVTDHTRPAPSDEMCTEANTKASVALAGWRGQKQGIVDEFARCNGTGDSNDANSAFLAEEAKKNSIFLEHSEVVDRICAEPAGLPHFEGHCLQGAARTELAELLRLVKQPKIQGCPSCAIVGSSGNVLGSQMGPAIDAHDVVVRFGCAPTQGFEPDVGSKTTHRFMYPEAITADGPDGAGEENNPCGGVVDWEQENSTALIRLYKPMDVFWWTDLLKGRDWRRDISEEGGFWRDVPETQGSDFRPPMMVLNPSWMERVSMRSGLSLESVPSQGMMGVLLALSACGKVDIYGFGAETVTGDKLDLAHMHYFE